jgi:hypothetical protein
MSGGIAANKAFSLLTSMVHKSERHATECANTSDGSDAITITPSQALTTTLLSYGQREKSVSSTEQLCTTASL